MNEYMNKLLIITPHMSTGGSPQYVLEYIKHFKNTYSCIKLIEVTNFSNKYEIQKDKVKEIIGVDNYYCLGNITHDEDQWVIDKMEIFDIIEDYCPDIIWMNDIPEAYEYKKLPEKVIEKLYRHDRPYKIIETTHSNSFDFGNKIYIGDEFMFCTKIHIEKSKNIDIPKKIWEVPIKKNDKPNRKDTLNKLGLDPDYYHVLNVGLLCDNKNQKYIFDISDKMKHKKVMFHFIGNDCFIDQCNISNDQINNLNCKIWGERSDVDIFMSCMDLFLFPSKKELNPIVIKEALSWEMDIIANKDEYLNYYDSIKIIDEIDVIKYISDKSFDILIDNKFIVSDFSGIKLEILGNNYMEYKVDFIDRDSNKILYTDTIKNNMWTSPIFKYYVNWEIRSNNEIVYQQNLEKKNVLINFGSSSLGDTIAWFNHVYKFKEKHDCNITVSTFHNSLFEESNKYSDIKFIYPGDPYQNIHKIYDIGWFTEESDDNRFDRSKCPINFRKEPLQKTSSSILGVNYNNTKPDIYYNPLDKHPLNGNKYVCISIHSTAQAKYWNNPNGWQDIVNYLNKLEYKVVLISKEKDGYMGNNHPKGIIDLDLKLDKVINYLKHCDFFIGLSSGLSWLSWALNIPTILISGFSKEYTEFNGDGIYRIINKDVCNGCFNTHVLNKYDWNWCPLHQKSDREYECTKEISSNLVIKNIDNLINDL